MREGRLSLVVGLAAACAIVQGCTDGTTADCSDAQCLVVSVVEASGDVVADDSGGDEDDSGGDATQATPGNPESDAGEVGVGDAGEAGPASGDAAADSGATDGAGDARDAVDP